MTIRLRNSCWSHAPFRTPLRRFGWRTVSPLLLRGRAGAGAVVAGHPEQAPPPARVTCAGLGVRLANRAGPGGRTERLVRGEAVFVPRRLGRERVRWGGCGRAPSGGPCRWQRWGPGGFFFLWRQTSGEGMGFYMRVQQGGRGRKEGFADTELGWQVKSVSTGISWPREEIIHTPLFPSSNYCMYTLWWSGIATESAGNSSLHSYLPKWVYSWGGFLVVFLLFFFKETKSIVADGEGGSSFHSEWSFWSGWIYFKSARLVHRFFWTL